MVDATASFLVNGFVEAFGKTVREGWRVGVDAAGHGF